MWRKTFLLLFHVVGAAAASQCRQGATFPGAVVSPAVESSGILRVPAAGSLAQCVAAGCELPGYDVAWIFRGRCYVLSCRRRSEDCRPRQRRGAASVLAFLRRSSPGRGEPFGGRWRSAPEAPGDLEALKDLVLFDGEDSEEEMLSSPPRGDGFNQSEAEEGGPEGGVAQNRASSWGNEATRPPAAAEEETTKSQSSTDSTSLFLRWRPTADDDIKTPLPATAEPQHPISTQAHPGQPLISSLGDPVEEPMAPTETINGPFSPEYTTDGRRLFQSATPPTAPNTQKTSTSTQKTSTSTQTTSTSTQTTSTSTQKTSTSTQTTSTNTQKTSTPSISPPIVATTKSGSKVGGSKCGPVAIVGPDRKLFLPVSSFLLNGSGSTDNRRITSYHWEAVSGPPGLQMEAVDQAVATATGLRAGRYTFRLTVTDEDGETDSSSMTVRVQEARSLPPVAHASGSHTLTLPNNSLVLRGSVTEGDQTEVHFLWVRDSQSPAAGDVLFGSAQQASLVLANLVEGNYLFRLQVTDAQGRCSTATATVEVQPEPGGGEQVDLELQVSVGQVSVSQRDAVLRQLAALLHVLDSDVHIRALQAHSALSTVLRFSVGGPSGFWSGSSLAALLRKELLQGSDFLLFRVLRVDTVVCVLRCSGQGQCDAVTKQCICDPFWTENLLRRYLGDGESNCDWRVLYVILTSFVLMVFILSVSWTFICCCKRRRQMKVRRKTRYTILDNVDEERVELRPKFSIKHRSTEQNSSLMLSESELDSDQDVFSRDRPVRSRRGQACRHGNAFG